MNYNLIGREKETHELEYLMQSEKSEFLAVYGRRRVGKSYLIDEVYGANMVFRTGSSVNFRGKGLGTEVVL